MELSGVVWKVEEARDGASFRWGTLGSDLVAEWRGVLVLRVGADGRSAVVESDPGAPPGLIEKTQNGIARAFLRSILGKVSFHASSVENGEQAMLLIGPSGSGKSTVADGLCRSHGFRLLADDVAAVDVDAGHWVVSPTESKVWLTTDGSLAGGDQTPRSRGRRGRRPAPGPHRGARFRRHS